MDENELRKLTRQSGLMVIRSRCFICLEYGLCAIGYRYDGRVVHIGIECGCLEKDIAKRNKLREEGSVNVSYC